MPNLLEEILPEKARYKDVVRVCDICDGQLQVMADIVSQKAVCFFA
jgi:hypothetical protein